MRVLRTQLTAALLLALFSGAAAIAHQVLWTRRLVDVLGASADTFSKVIGAFFVGLALGAWFASRPAATCARFWLRVASAEFAVAALAVPVLFSTELAGLLWQQPAHDAWVKWLLPPILVTPPAVAMGLVVPWVLRALARNEWFGARHPGWLYAINTLGGVAGITFVLIGLPHLGLTGASVVAIALNIFVACGAVVLGWSSRIHRKQVHRSDAAAQSLLTLAPAEKATTSLAFASGFLVLGLEVVVQHQLAQVTINSLFSSAVVLALVLVSLTVSAMLMPWLVRFAGGEERALTWSLLGSALLCAAEPFLLTGLRDGVKILPYELPLPSYLGEVIELGLVAICPMFVACGLVFPLLLRSVATEESGRRMGVLFAWNGLGGWLGAELSQALLAPAFGLWQSVVAVGASYAGLWLTYAFSFAVRSSSEFQQAKRKTKFVTGFSLLAVLVASVWFARALPQATVGPHEYLRAFRLGREGAVATVECGPGDWRILFNNSYTLGGSKAQFNQERQGLLPLLLHGQPRSVATLGVATGSTVAGAALHPEVKSIDAIELSPLVLKYADQFFSPYNRDVFRDPRLHFIQEDARWIIAGKQASYDVVVGDLFLPWRTGEGRLFTLEHFQNVRRSLKPDGLFCQWLPLFQLTRPQFDTIVRTFREVFPDSLVIRGDFYTELPILGLVGGRELTQVDWQRVESICTRLRASGKVTDPLVRHPDGVAMLVVGPLPTPSHGPVNTLANAWLEWDAGQNILGMRSPWFIGVPCAEYVRDAHRLGHSLLPPELRSAHEAGQFFLTLEIAAKLNLPVLAELKAQVPTRTPAALRDDQRADWQQWPMRVKPDFNPSSR